MTEQEAYEQELARFEKLGQIAQQRGVTVGGVVVPPKLNRDGSLKEVKLEEDSK